MEDELLELLEWEKPRTRTYLSIKLKISPRKVERLIAKLRDRGEPICSNSESEGYWLSTGADWKRTIKEMEHRAFALLERTRKMKERQLEGQIKWNSEN